MKKEKFLIEEDKRKTAKKRETKKFRGETPRNVNNKNNVYTRGKRDLLNPDVCVSMYVLSIYKARKFTGFAPVREKAKISLWKS